MIVDTNVLVRAWAGDDPAQATAAQKAFREAERVHVSSAALCEFVWVARQVYKQTRPAIAEALRLLISDPRIVVDGPAVAAGLHFLEVGGDFADGVIEFEGRKLGGEAFVTFDRRAHAVIKAQGRQSTLLAGGEMERPA